MSAGLRAAHVVIRAAAWLAPGGSRERMRREWEAELAAAAERGEDGGALLRTAVGAFADARALRSLEWSRRTRSEDLMSGWTQGWLREVKVALRSLLRAPAYSAVAVLTLAIGLGGSAAIYTLLERVVLDPLPYPESERLVRVDNVVPGVDPEARWSTSFAQYVYLSDHSETLDEVGIYSLGGANLQTPSGPERVRAATITAEVLELLGARAERGRLMSVDDNLPGAAPVVVLSHGFWSRAMGADPDVVGRTIQLDDGPFEVAGVLEPGTELPDAAPGSSIDVWRPFTINRAGEFYNSHTYRMLGRLASAADTARAEDEIAQLTARFPEAFPLAYSTSFFERYGFHTEVTALKNAVIGDAAQSLWILFAGVGLVLVIACANVANLFLVRMEARRRELAVRAALGAGRVHVARYLVAEGLVLAGSGAALALLFASLAMRGVTAISLAGLPRVSDLALGSGTVLFTVALSLLAGVGLAVHPLLIHTRGGPAGALAEGGRSGSGGPSGSRFRDALVVTQVAIALVLAVSAGLLVESMRRLTRVDPGIDPEGVLTLQLNLTSARYPDDPSLWRFYGPVLERVGTVPGVVAAGMSQDLPLSGGFGCTIQAFDDPAVTERLKAAGLTTCAGEELTTPGYFQAMGIPLLAGRALERADVDDPTRGAVVVSRAFAERFWPGEDPLGKHVAPSGRNRGYHSVVGVVGDVPAETVEGDRAIAIYYPVVVNPATDLTLWPGGMSLVVKTTLADPSSLLPSIRQAIAEVDPTVPVTNPLLAQDLIGRSMARLSFTALLLGVAAGTALLLAAVGLYGVLSYAVTRRTREIGMRIAIGARPGQVEWMVVAQSLGLACVGLLVGLAAAFAGTRVLGGLLYGVEPTDPFAFGGAAGLLLVVALVASWLPARRAARVDPSVALREG